ncbi:hypothetical protein GCM10027159_06830 [Lysobacter terrae]
MEQAPDEEVPNVGYGPYYAPMLSASAKSPLTAIVGASLANLTALDAWRLWFSLATLACDAGFPARARANGG